MNRIRQSTGFIVMAGIAAIALMGNSVHAEIRDEISRTFQVETGGTLTIDTQRGSIEVQAARGYTV